MSFMRAATSRAAGEQARSSSQAAGLLWGLLGVALFSGTLPMTKLALGAQDAPQLSPWFVAIGRAALAGMLALLVLAFSRPPWPQRAHVPALVWTALGVVFGFPLLTTWALRHVPSSHAAVMIGLLPLATALAATWINGDRPSRGFWMCALAGSAVVVAYAARQGMGSLHLADLALMAAMAAAALGYAHGARLAGAAPQGLGSGANVICWALVFSLPINALLMLPWWAEAEAMGRIAAPAWLGFTYVSVVSMFLGFFAWYRGLAMGGVARVSQLQLLQPFLTLLLGVPILAEALEPATLAAALLVVALVAAGRAMPVARAQGVRT